MDKKMRLVVVSGPDKQGRSHFRAYWRTEGGRERGQVFHARVDRYAEKFRERGYEVEFRDER